MSQPSPSQRDEYRKLFDTLEIRSERAKTIDKLCASALALVPRYTIVSARTGVPWYFLAAVHLRESTFKIAHLHNGDPLSARTVHVPAGLPKTPEPPYTFEQSAEDALRQKDLHQWTDWGLTGTLYQLESYNGMGYRKRGKPSPYLWSFSTTTSMASSSPTASTRIPPSMANAAQPRSSVVWSSGNSSTFPTSPISPVQRPWRSASPPNAPLIPSSSNALRPCKSGSIVILGFI